MVAMPAVSPQKLLYLDFEIKHLECGKDSKVNAFKLFCNIIAAADELELGLVVRAVATINCSCKTRT